MELTDEQRKAAELEAENKASGNGDNTEDEDTADDDDGGDNPNDGVEKKDYSQMSEEDIMSDLKEKYQDKTPEELMLEMAKQMKIIGHKNRAITSLKKNKNDVAEKKQDVNKDEVDDLDKPLTKRDLQVLENKNKVETLASRMTTDVKEKQAIIDAYNNDIVKSGDIEKDFKKAFAIANSGIVEDYKKNSDISKKNENYLTNFSGGQSFGDTSGGQSNNAVKNATAENLRKAGFSQKEIDATLSKL